MLSSGPHDEFLELCALATSGQLTKEEQARLEKHLSHCASCREALHQYESVIDNAIPAIAPDDLRQIDPGPRWNQAKAERALFERLAREEPETQLQADESSRDGNDRFHRVLPIAPQTTWSHVWMLYAAGILLFVTLGLCAYWVGIRRGTTVALNRVPSTNSKSDATPQSVASQTVASLEEQLSDAAHEREIARAATAEREKAMVALKRQLEEQSREITRMKEMQDQLETALQNGNTARQDLVQQRADVAQKLETAQSESQSLRSKMQSLASESTQQTAKASSLTSKVNELTQLLQDREKTIEQQEELLAHDRDIRELMGARDLYIAEMYDVGDNGLTRKPYGRVFYTKGKSLIFYAYDLDQQGVRRGQEFQAWGRRGPDWKQATNLGVLYEDNASKKRWILKLDDPKTLAQIDAVFVTLEPHGGSDKPSSKPLLFAYLRLNPNHP